MAGSPVPGEAGAAASVSAEAFPTLAAAVRHIGKTKATLLVSRAQKVKDLAIPANIEVRITPGGSIDVADGTRVVISGPFEAPPTRVFTGEGAVTFTPPSPHVARPEWWGGGNGINSAAAIQSAIDSLEQGEVRLSEGAYLLDRRVRIRLVDSGDKVDTILVPKSGVDIVGEGRASVLKVVDNFTAGGDYVVFAPLRGERVADASFRNFLIDGNGSRNLVRGMSGNLVRRAMAFWLFAGKNIRIDAMWFENHPGTNVVKFGSDSLSHLVTDSVIANCTFSNVGGAIPGNRKQGDHSTIYISGRNITISDNRLSNPFSVDANGPPPIVVAGIEMHGDDMVVTGNRVENYGTGGYIVGDGIVTARNQKWTGNTFLNLSQLGISLWSISGAGDLVVEGNEIELNGALDQGVAGIFQSLHPPDTTLGIDGIAIRNNRIYGTNVKAGTVWNGIQLTAARDAVVEGNVIERVSGAGIAVIGTGNLRPDCRNIAIRGNTVRDTGFNGYGAYPYAIEIVNNGRGRFDGISVTGNRIESTLALAAAMRGIRVQGPGPVAGVRIDAGNRFNLKEKEFRVDRSRLAEGVTVEAEE